MDQSDDLAETGGCLGQRVDGLARGHVDRRDAHLVPGVAEDLRRGVRVLCAHVRKQDMLADANAARDRLANLARSDDNDHIAHSQSSSGGFAEVSAVCERAGPSWQRLVSSGLVAGAAASWLGGPG